MTTLTAIRIHKVKTTIFIPLPKEQHRPINGGCGCVYCKEHPGKIPAWDTLAVNPDCERTWTVHYPEIQTA